MDRRRFLALTGGAGLGTGMGLALAGSAEAAGGPYFNRRIPDEAHTQIGALNPQGITSFSFTPSNGWVVMTQTGAGFARGIPDECYTKLVEMVGAGTTINCIAFPPAGGNSWVILGHNSLFARGIPQECYEKILEFYNSGQPVVHVAFPPSGGNSWVVVGSNGGFFARGIDDECYQMMRNLSQGGRKVTRVAFPYTGGWTVIAQDEFFARGIDNECFQQMRNFAAGGWQLHNVAFSPVNNGWSLISRGQVPALPFDRIRQIEGNVGGKDIWSRMADYKTPGVAIAAVLNNQVAWSTGYGWLESGNWSAATHPESAFQAASISKPVSTIGFLRMLQGSTTLGLNSDIRPLLNWQLGKRACVAATTGPTIDQLLGHRGGVIGRGSTSPANVCTGFDGSGGGFGGYGPGAVVPTLLQILNGQGNSPRIELSTEPGAAFYYSGHGFELLHRMLEVQTGQTLATYMQNNVFAQLGMSTSSFSLTPPFELASGHTTAGAVIPGRRNRYPESSAAGLYTNVVDLCRLIRWINLAWASPTTIAGPLNKNWVTALLSQGATPGMGRGFFTANVGTNQFNYGHGGSNYGFQSNLVGYPALGTGFAVMINGDNGNLVGEITNSIKSAYGWS